MRHYLLLIIKLFFFWWIIFSINRLLFILFFFQKFDGIGASEIAAAFLHGAALDLSAACYLMVIPALFVMLHMMTSFAWLRSFIFIYSAGVALIASLVCVYDLAIYSDWGTKLTYRAMQYLAFANEGAAFTDVSDILVLLILVILQMGIAILLLKRMLNNGSAVSRLHSPGTVPAFIFSILLTAALILGIRGGWQQIPINESSAYFSQHQVVNDAAVNTLWNAGKKALDNNKARHSNPYRFLDAGEAESRVNGLYTPSKDSVIQLMNTTRPNVVIILLESFTASVVASLGGEKDVTPYLDTLIRRGFLFSNIYSQGFRTDQGLASVFSGFPAQPNFSIVMSPEKYASLHFLPGIMADHGYHNSFFYGGETEFANMKAYLLKAGIFRIVDKSSFPAGEMNAKWGAHDGYVFRKQAAAMKNEKTPFLSVILSLSSHEPFTVPMETRFAGSDIPSQFKNSCAYTDLSLKEYFEQVKQEVWYPNTLFILVADHGHLQPRNLSPREPARFHIPLLFFGEVLRPEFRGKRTDCLGMQTDLPATLLSQLQMDAKEFTWSNNLLNPYRNNFAYYTSDDAFGWLNDDGAMLYDFKTNNVVQSTMDPDQAKDGQAFLQVMFEQYTRF